MEIITVRCILQNPWCPELMCPCVRFTSPISEKTEDLLAVEATGPVCSAALRQLCGPRRQFWHIKLIFQPREKRGRFVPSDR